MKRALEADQDEQHDPTDDRSQELKDEDERMFIEVTTKGRKILPTNIRKFTGSIQFQKDSMKWRTEYSGEFGHLQTICNHKTREEAEARIIKTALSENLPIANVIYEYENQYYCALTQHQLMKFSYNRLHHVNDHFWCARFDKSVHSYYAITQLKIPSTEKKKHITTGFHRLIHLPLEEGKSIDHKNHETLNNNDDNLRVSDLPEQAINKRIRSTNKSGITGVRYDKTKKAWVAEWREDKKRRAIFTVSVHGERAFDMAVAHRKEKEMMILKYRKALHEK